MRFVTFLGISVLLLLGACREEKPTRIAPKPIHSIVFVDESARVGRDTAYARGKYARFLERLVTQNLRSRGDRLRMYALRQDAAPSSLYDFEVISQLDDTTGMSPVDAETVRLDFATAIKLERRNALRACMAHLLNAGAGGRSKYTDIWGSIGVLAAQVDTTAITRAYYLSDMMECMQGENRRNFRVRPPGNRTEATRWATEDAAHLQEKLPRLRWQSTELYMVLPFGPMSTTKENNPAVTYYWEELFRRLGVPGAIAELHP